ncbi:MULTISPECIES: iron ABC transporter ATP-binding protein [Brochothrix]|uniref:Petrobactin iron-siderophore ABC transporter (ATP-binding protein) n=1 Tax=Brochothrix thermosphacta TaxID=2756 RepID=A0A2X0S956_BROTH|nr:MULTISPECIES: ATP-binding cassette domain-containing protein [Brochothrix]ANZ95230.1 iron ABC transporter ATP-binding protein [Brochothrix thermosphacta]MBR5526409.1 ATP-binding cassette domain-containing protein [Brochothrix sp.]MDO7864088.1 ATP-binding cassette domain-containing protein [Brochothrix thermosphacta]ODJ52388.1 iron ABC transporter ATP-binding protein [Brochothrix thermosphacta]ODJ58674.1 iron ABC transporter ATP-binding protein [Brochothrix thermosphacta]
MLQSKKLSKKYQDKLILDDITLEIPQAQVTAFIGANGAGKSTLLGIMSRLITKEDGEVLIDDQDVTKWKSRALAQKLAILKQSNQVSARLTVEDLVAFGRFPYSKGRLTLEDQQKVTQALEYMEITDLKADYIDELSGGQQQRVYIAMIIAQDTEYVLLDEPLNNLDMKHAVQMMKILRRLVDDFGKTIVLVLHDINFASAYADYMVGLKDGRIVAQGSTAEMMTPEQLNIVYDMPLAITEIDSCKYCLYFK